MNEQALTEALESIAKRLEVIENKLGIEAQLEAPDLPLGEEKKKQKTHDYNTIRCNRDGYAATATLTSGLLYCHLSGDTREVLTEQLTNRLQELRQRGFDVAGMMKLLSRSPYWGELQPYKSECFYSTMINGNAHEIPMLKLEIMNAELRDLGCAR